jgi:hypothetical protein
MRTCAAAIMRDDFKELLPVYQDAADLLIEAADALEPAADPLGDPMTLIEPKPPGLPEGRVTNLVNAMTGTWIDPGGALPQPRGNFNPRACPKCDSRANKRVTREGNKLMLACPVCSTQWEWMR